jgi:RNA polymerase sigma-70 factor (ECF subfamily)
VSESTAPTSAIRALLRDVTRSEPADADLAPSDAGLMAELGEGHVEALERLYDRYSSLVFSVALRVLTDRPLAEDVTQEVFLRLWRRPWSYDPERGRFRSWLMSVTRNRSIDERRRVVRRLRLEEREDERRPDPPATGRFHDPQLETVLAEERRAVRDAMTRLPPPQREVIELAYFGGLTQVEIAAQTGEPLGTVKTRVRLGIQKLRAALVGLRSDGSEIDDAEQSMEAGP